MIRAATPEPVTSPEDFGRALEALRLLTVDEVAAVASVDERTVREWIARGELPWVNVSRNPRCRRVRRRVRPADLARFLDGRQVQLTPPARRRRRPAYRRIV
jgi:excisionase family DNA binding protein